MFLRISDVTLQILKFRFVVDVVVVFGKCINIRDGIASIFPRTNYDICNVVFFKQTVAGFRIFVHRFYIGFLCGIVKTVEV